MLQQETRTAIEQLLQHELTYTKEQSDSNSIVWHKYALEIPLMDDLHMRVHITWCCGQAWVGMDLFVENYYECNGRDIDFSLDLYHHHMENTHQQEHLVIESVKEGLATSRQEMLSMLLRIPSTSTQPQDMHMLAL
jgi:hypothetical protein